MLEIILIYTLSLSGLSGIGALYFGKKSWRKLKLKFIGVVLATMASFGFLLIHSTNNSLIISGNLPLSAEYVIMSIIRNLAFIIFHISTGRDAMQLHQGDRRKNV